MFKNQPKGLIPAALSNMGERFGYYIMNAVLVLFLCSKFGLKEETSAIIYSCFYAGIYVLSLVGGLIADKTRNYKGTIITYSLHNDRWVISCSPSRFSQLLKIRHGSPHPHLRRTLPDSIRKRYFSKETCRQSSVSCMTTRDMPLSVTPASRSSTYSSTSAVSSHRS